MVIMVGVIGYAMRLFELPAPPFLLGFILGPMLEEHFRRAMIVARGDFAVFVQRPVSATVLAIALAILMWGLYSAFARRGRVSDGSVSAS
jgi:TctA family transporter